MSFILDALKKAESERSRASGPVLVDVRIAPPRRRLPAWAWVLGSVLLANLAVLAWLLLRKPAAGPAPMPAAGVIEPAPVAQPSHILPPATLRPDSAAPLPMPMPMPATPALNAPLARTDNLPTLQQLQATGVALPALQLNLHVYDPDPTQRYVILNGARLAEGQATADGVKVETINERGVVLEARGQRFLLTIGG